MPGLLSSSGPDKQPTSILVTILFAASVPVIMFYAVLPSAIVKFVIVTNVEQYKEPEAIMEVVRKMRATKAFHVLQLFAALQVLVLIYTDI
jgi:hypothetical protein